MKRMVGRIVLAAGLTMLGWTAGRAARPIQDSPGPSVVFEPASDGERVRAVVRFTSNNQSREREWVLEATSIRVQNTDLGVEIAADAASVTFDTGHQQTWAPAYVLLSREGSQLPPVSIGSSRPVVR